MKSTNEPTSYRELIRDDYSLALFLEALKQFDQDFCDMMTKGKDFTLRLEVRGNCGEVIHGRVSRDYFDRPAGVEKRIEDSKKKVKRSSQ